MIQFIEPLCIVVFWGRGTACDLPLLWWFWGSSMPSSCLRLEAREAKISWPTRFFREKLWIFDLLLLLSTDKWCCLKDTFQDWTCWKIILIPFHLLVTMVYVSCCNLSPSCHWSCYNWYNNMIISICHPCLWRVTVTQLFSTLIGTMALIPSLSLMSIIYPFSPSMFVP